jgi:K+-sensing histidine kinase KdpD
MAERESEQSPTGSVAEERLLVCVSEAPGTAALICYAQRAESEAERRNRFVGNLLDMTRLESGAIELRLDLVEPVVAHG